MILRLEVKTMDIHDSDCVHSHLRVVYIENGKRIETGEAKCVHRLIPDHYEFVDQAVNKLEEYALERGMKFELAKV